MQDPIARHRSSLFGHVAKLPEDAPVHQALRCHIDLSLSPGGDATVLDDCVSDDDDIDDELLYS